MKGKMIHFGRPYGCSPEDLRELHLKVAEFLVGVINIKLFRAGAHAQLNKSKSNS